MNLHYSQTNNFIQIKPCLFDYHMNLHYSQTASRKFPMEPSLTTIWIYTTLKLSVLRLCGTLRLTTIWIYTTLKRLTFRYLSCFVWLPYESTLLSNVLKYLSEITLVWLPYESTLLSNSPSGGITVKRVWLPYESTLLSNYCTKHCKIYAFDYHMNLHYSQTASLDFSVAVKFDYHMNLHYSQTLVGRADNHTLFDYHMNLHYSQT